MELHHSKFLCLDFCLLLDIIICILTQAHDKCISAACFVNKGSTRFVTASNDMTMVLWEILHKKEGIIVRQVFNPLLKCICIKFSESLIKESQIQCQLLSVFPHNLGKHVHVLVIFSILGFHVLMKTCWGLTQQNDHYFGHYIHLLIARLI